MSDFGVLFAWFATLTADLIGMQNQLTLLYLNFEVKWPDKPTITKT